MKFPKPKKHFIWGHLPLIRQGEHKCFSSALDKIQRHMGSVYQLDILGQKWVVCSDEKIMRQCLIKDWKHFHKGRTLDIAKSLGIGTKGLTESEGKYWKDQHKLTMPFFTDKFTKGILGQVHKTVDKSFSFIDKYDEIELFDFCNRVSFTFISKFACNYQAKCLNDFESQDDLLIYQRDVIKNFMIRIRRGPLWRFVPAPSNIKYYFTVRKYRNFFKDIIKQRESTSDSTSRDLLNVLLNGKYGDKEISYGEIIDQLHTVIAAGYETTGSLYHWFIVEVAKDKTLYQKIRQEALSLGPIENWTMESINELPHFSMALNETFRVHGSIPLIIREVLSDLETDIGRFERNQFVFFNLSMMHKSSFWGKDPLDFRPERFLEEDIAQNYKQHLYPFGAGMRKCIGEKLARMEISVFVLRTILDYQFELDPNNKIIPFHELARTSKFGTKIKFIKNN